MTFEQTQMVIQTGALLLIAGAVLHLALRKSGKAQSKPTQLSGPDAKRQGVVMLLLTLGSVVVLVLVMYLVGNGEAR
jgi:hypothetical protein